jgi:hypothetical protein
MSDATDDDLRDVFRLLYEGDEWASDGEDEGDGAEDGEGQSKGERSGGVADVMRLAEGGEVEQVSRKWPSSTR